MADDDNGLHNLIEYLLQQGPPPILPNVLQGPMGNANAGNQPMQHHADLYVGAQPIPNVNANQGPMGNANAGNQPMQHQADLYVGAQPIPNVNANQGPMGNANAGNQPMQHQADQYVGAQPIPNVNANQDNDLHNLMEALLQQGPPPNLHNVLQGPMGNANAAAMQNLNQGDAQEEDQGADNENLDEGEEQGQDQVVNNQNPIQVGLDTLEQGVPALAHLIQQHHPRHLIFEGANMTLFQRLTRALIEFFSRSNRRPNIYRDLIVLCQGHVTPQSVSNIEIDDFVQLGVAGRAKARGIINLAVRYLQEDVEELNHLEPQAAYASLKRIDQVGARGAFYMTIFGLQNLNYFPSPELDFRKKLGQFSPRYNNYPREEEARNDYLEWDPFRGLGAFLVWWYS